MHYTAFFPVSLLPNGYKTLQNGKAEYLRLRTRIGIQEALGFRASD